MFRGIGMTMGYAPVQSTFLYCFYVENYSGHKNTMYHAILMLHAPYSSALHNACIACSSIATQQSVIKNQTTTANNTAAATTTMIERVLPL
eukprot:1450904-Ditylum_brightwellii.AAC.1